jgi:hypothetical protein
MPSDIDTAFTHRVCEIRRNRARTATIAFIHAERTGVATALGAAWHDRAGSGLEDLDRQASELCDPKCWPDTSSHPYAVRLVRALARKFGDVFAMPIRSLLAASRCPVGAATERCFSSGATLFGLSLATTASRHGSSRACPAA